MSEVPTIIILPLVSGAPNQQRCTWFLRELIQDEFTLLAMAKKSLSASTAMTGVGQKIAGRISGLASKLTFC